MGWLALVHTFSYGYVIISLAKLGMLLVDVQGGTLALSYPCQDPEFKEKKFSNLFIITTAVFLDILISYLDMLHSIAS